MRTICPGQLYRGGGLTHPCDIPLRSNESYGWRGRVAPHYRREVLKMGRGALVKGRPLVPTSFAPPALASLMIKSSWALVCMCVCVIS